MTTAFISNPYIFRITDLVISRSESFSVIFSSVCKPDMAAKIMLHIGLLISIFFKDIILFIQITIIFDENLI